jgi:spore germination protein GerM
MPLALALLMVPAGCGGGASTANRSETSVAEDSTTWTTVYVLIDDGAAPVGVRRTIRTKSPYAREALAALLAGPSDAERAAGVTTAIPSSARLLSLSFRATTARGGTEAVADLSGLTGVTDAIRTARVITQVARTLIGHSDIDRVTFRSHGRPWGNLLMDGSVDDGPFDYRRLDFDIGYGCAGTEIVVCDRFDGLP